MSPHRINERLDDPWTWDQPVPRADRLSDSLSCLLLARDRADERPVPRCRRRPPGSTLPPTPPRVVAVQPGAVAIALQRRPPWDPSRVEVVTVTRQGDQSSVSVARMVGICEV